MPKIPLIGGAYETRSLMANAQRCVNLYPETNPKDAESPYTYYQTPGLVPRVTGMNVAPVRGMCTATNGALYAVVGDKVWYINQDFVATQLGTIAPNLGQVRMKDNGIELVIVDGTTDWYRVELATNNFAKLSDSSFYGSDWVDYLDTFMIFNKPGSAAWYTTLSNTLTLDPLYIAQKTGGPDPVVAAVVNRDEIWVIGQRTTEIWTNVGAAQFPFQRLSGVFIEHGCAAKYSIAAWDKMVFWLSQDKAGRARVSMVQPYDLADVSTYAIEQELADYERLDDAIAFIYQQQGHVFYQLTFPTADKTWVYDIKEKLWHQRASVDGDGNWHRHRANCGAFAYGKNLVGDYQNGLVYSYEIGTFTDNSAPIPRLRTFPHLVNNGKRITYDAFIADVEVGTYVGDEIPLVTPPALADNLLGPWIALRWSDSRAKSFGNHLMQPLGMAGEFMISPIWRQLGMARDRIFELSWSVAAEVALSGAWVEVTQQDT